MKLIENYTPSKGLVVAVLLLILDLVIQLSLMSSIINFKVIENMVYCDLSTVAVLSVYVLTAVCLLIILSEIFVMKKLESLFAFLGENRVEETEIVEETVEPVEELIIDNEEILELEEEPEIEINEDFIIEIKKEEEPIDDIFLGLSEDETVEEDAEDNNYKMFSIKMDDVDSENIVENDEPEEDLFMIDVSESEILQTLTELKNIMNDMKSRKRGLLINE
jgi:hypothetical protein